jgi:CMP-N-acetylneuraminic acid synthetase
MSINDEFIVIIPARAGSKGVPEKNIQLIGGKPMIQFTIEAAISVFNLKNILITSNDQKVLDIAVELGLKIPFIRPDELSTDVANTNDVIKHALNWYQIQYKTIPKNFILLQPTSPFRDSNDIVMAIKQFSQSHKKTLVSASEPIQHPNDFILKDQDGKFKRLGLGKDSCRRQAYPEVFFIDGGIYIAETNHFLEAFDLIGDDPDVFLTEQFNSIDIDTPFDLEWARAMHNYRLSHD